MQVKTAYRGHSGLSSDRGTGARLLRMAPDVDRDAVRFDGELAEPLRFREDISALHDVVISDLRFEKRDKSAYQAWKKDQLERERAVHNEAYVQAKEEFNVAQGGGVTPELEKQYQLSKKRYWKARQALNGWLRKNDPALWRKLMPYDPVMTVADDSLFFECFSADESTYGCLSVQRGEGFQESGSGSADTSTRGTTNVDYSWELYDHFQSLRSYRPTHFAIEPDGFEVKTGESAPYREEKIDLPDGWLRGFGQLQAAMAMPMRKVTLDVAAVYSLLAHLKRHKAHTSPRAVRFELVSGQAPAMVLEPWETRIDRAGPAYSGPDAIGDSAVRIWGRRRLLVLARALPLADSVDVYLLGTGLPTFWVVRMGNMHLTLGLSGWTTNDWSRGSALDQLMPRVEPSDGSIAVIATKLQAERALSLDAVAGATGQGMPEAAAALNQLALRGQVIFDLERGVYRWRQMLPMALSDKELGPSNSERDGAEEILKVGTAMVETLTEVRDGGVVLVGKSAGKPCEVLVDVEGRITKGKCVCGHHYQFGLRNGPCRHLQSLRDLHLGVRPKEESTLTSWFAERRHWAQP